MNNKKKSILYIILGIAFVLSLSFLAIILNINSELENHKDIGVYISCDKDTISRNNKVSCSIKGVSNKNLVSAVSILAKSTENLIIENAKVSSIWQGEEENGNIQLYTDTNKTGKFDILKFDVSLKDENKENCSIYIEKAEFFDEKFNSYVVSSNEIHFKVM